MNPPSRQQQGGVAECEECDETGIYREGAEWAPCQSCERGKDFAECLRTFAREQQADIRERLLDAADGYAREVIEQALDAALPQHQEDGSEGREGTDRA